MLSNIPKLDFEDNISNNEKISYNETPSDLLDLNDEEEKQVASLLCLDSEQRIHHYIYRE